MSEKILEYPLEVSYWGHNMEYLNSKLIKKRSWMPPFKLYTDTKEFKFFSWGIYPKIGDPFKINMESGRQAIGKILKIEYCRGVYDMRKITVQIKFKRHYFTKKEIEQKAG